MMKQKKSRTYIWTWVLGILVVLASIIGGAAWYLSRQWRPLLDTQLKQLVLASSDSLYSIQYSDLQINLVTGNATIKDFKLIPDSNVYKKLLAAQKAPDNLYDLQVASLKLVNFHPKALYSEKKLNINSIVIDNPTLIITNRRQPYNDTVPVSRPKTLYQLVSKVFKVVSVKDISLKDIDFSFVNKSNLIAKKTSLRNLNITVSDILIDSVSETDESRFYNTRNVEVQMKGYKIATADSLYYLNFDNIQFSVVNRRITLDKMSLEPRYSIANFYKKVGYSKDRFNIEFKGIAINRINIRKFTRDQVLYAGELDLEKVLVEVYNSNVYKKRPSVKKGKFPHQQLQKLALDLKIDTLNLHQADISYEEFDKTSKRTGKITFERTNGKIYNVTNDSAALSKNKIMRADLNTKVMGKGNLDINFTFDLTDKLGAFTYAGTLGKMNGKELNKITTPLGMIEVAHANINKLQFSAKANEIGAHGKMQFYYDNLSVKVLQRDKQTGALKDQGFISSIANVFVLHTANPNAKGNFTYGTIDYTRPATVSFFSMLWQSLFTGIKESVGVSKDRETKLRNTVTQVGSFIGRIKEKREENKKEREIKRLERKKEKEVKDSVAGK